MNKFKIMHLMLLLLIVKECYASFENNWKLYRDIEIYQTEWENDTVKKYESDCEFGLVKACANNIDKSTYIEIKAMKVNSPDLVRLRFYNNKEKTVVYDIDCYSWPRYKSENIYLVLLDDEEYPIIKEKINSLVEGQYTFHGMLKMDLKKFEKIKWFRFEYDF